jgi:hypothetical protein
MTESSFCQEASAILRKRFPDADDATIQAEVQAVAARIQHLQPAGHDADGRAYVTVTAIARCFGVPIEDLRGLLELIPENRKRLEDELFRVV